MEWVGVFGVIEMRRGEERMSKLLRDLIVGMVRENGELREKVKGLESRVEREKRRVRENEEVFGDSNGILLSEMDRLERRVKDVEIGRDNERIRRKELEGEVEELRDRVLLWERMEELEERVGLLEDRRVGGGRLL